MPDRPLSIEERQKFEARGVKIPVNAVVDEKGDIYESGAPAANPEVPNVSKPEAAYHPAGLFPRQFGKAILPMLGGAGATTAAVALAPTTGGASLLIPLAAGALGALGTGYLQQKGIEAYTKSNPDSALASIEKEAQEDVKRHPVWSTVSSLPASVVAPGGSFLPTVHAVRAMKAAPKVAAMLAGAQGGITAASEYAATGQVDPYNVLTSAALGPLFTKPRAPVAGARPTTADAAARSAADMGHTGPSKITPIHESLGLDVESILAAPADMLRASAKGASGPGAKFLNEIAFMKKQNVPLTAEDITKLSTEGMTKGFDKIRVGIMAGKVPTSMATEKQTIEMLNEANKRNALEAGVKPVKKAEESAQVFEAAGVPTEAELAAARQKATEEGVAKMSSEVQKNPPSPSTAEQAAETILASKKASKPLEDPIAAFRKEEAEIQKALTFAEQYPEGSPMRDEITRIAYARRQTAEQKLRDSISGAARVTPEQPLTAGTEEVKLPREVNEIEAFEPGEGGELNYRPPSTPPEPPGTPTKPGPVVDLGGTPYQRTATGWENVNTKQKFDRSSTEVGTKSLIETLDYYNEHPEANKPRGSKVEPTEEELAPVEEQPAPVSKVSQKATAGAKTTAGELKEVLEGIQGNPNLPEAPAVGSKKAQELGVAPKPGQEAKIPTPVQDFVNALGFTSADGGRARKLLSTHPSIGGKVPKSVDLMRESYNKLPVGDRLRMAELYNSGAENYVSKLTAAEQAKTTQARIGRTLSQPGKPATPEAPKGLQVKQAQQKAAEKGGEAGAILNPFPEGLGRTAKNVATKVKATFEKIPELNELIGMGVKKVGDVTITPLKRGIIIKGKRYGGLQGVLENLAERGPLGKYVSKALDFMDIQQNRVNNRSQDVLYKLGKTIPQEERTGPVMDYLMWRKHGEGTEPTLTPEQRKIVDEVYKIVDETGTARELAGPYVIRHTTGGKEISTPVEKIEGYVPEGIDPDIARYMRNQSHENEKRWLDLRDDYIQYQIQQGMSEEAAKKAFKNRLGPSISGEHNPNARFRALRVEMGEGLPPSWRDRDIIRVMKSYMTKYSHDMAFHRFVESDPIIAKAFGITENGRGEAHPDIVRIGGRDVIEGELLENPDAIAAFRHFIGGFEQSTQGLEKATHLVSSASLQTLTQAKNYIQNVFKTPELLKSDEYGLVRDAITKSLTEEAYQSALKAGSVKATRNVLPTVAQDIEGHITKLADLMTKGTGSEKIAQINDITLNAIGKQLAYKRILEKDAAFLDRFAPDKWREMDLDEVTDFIAAQFTRQFAGSYGPAGLPASLLRGNTSLIGRYFSLSRWSVERFNKWYKNVYEPATKGDFAPFMRSAIGTFVGAGVLNTLVELVQKKKPRELTWKEYLNLGGKDHAYTIFSKMAAMSDMGLLSDVLFGMVQFANKETPRGFNNLALSAATDATERIGQFVSAWGSEDIPGITEDPAGFMGALLKLGGNIIMDRVQMVRVALQKGDETGAREEKIAKRLGYMPKSGFNFSQELSDPFSMSGAYKAEDSKQLGRIIRNRMQAGQHFTIPDSELRTTARMMEGNKVGNYYKFIEESQGKQAREAALARDIENTKKKYNTLRKAIEE